MNPTIDAVCKKYGITPEEFFGEHPIFSFARKEVIQSLAAAGMKPKQISFACRCHVQTVYYWLRPERRRTMINKTKVNFRVHKLGGPKQTKAQRDEILNAYIEDRGKGTALAVSRGLSPLYAYKLANAMGAIPVKTKTKFVAATQENRA